MTDRDAPLPGLEELLRLNLEGELHRLPLERGMPIAGKWTLTRRLGAGGFGQVWEAWHVELQKKQAIKFLDGEHRDPAAVRARFLAEAQLLARLESKHLVRVLDYGELPDEVPYFVMELVQGPTLRQRMTEPLAVDRAVDIAKQLLQGLHDVHTRGLTHGDVKPENIILSGPEEKVRVLDFGLARITAQATGTAGGTPPYMAPELVLDGKPSSPCSDVYAVGVVLYEMLTGELPCGHGSMGLEEIRQSWEKKPDVSPMRVLRKEVPAALDEIVMKALSRDPSGRFETAGEMVEALRVLAGRMAVGLADTEEPGVQASTKATTETEPMGREPVATKSRQGLKVAAVIGAIALLAGLGWYWWPESESPRPAVLPLEGEPPRESPRLEAGIFAEAREGTLLVASDAAPAPESAAYGGLCSALRGAGKRLLCKRLPAAMIDADAIVAAADEDGVRVVVLVGQEIVVRSTSHDPGSPLVARLDGLPVPRESVIRDVAVLLRGVVDPVGSKYEAIPVLELREWDPRWVVLAEWLRARRGQDDPEAAVRLGDAKQALDRSPGSARDLAVLLWAPHASCEAAAAELTELTKPGLHEPGIRIQAKLELAACAVNGQTVSLERAARAKELVDEALEASGHPCVQVAALGTISRIDLWRRSDVLWQQHQRALTSEDACDDPATWSSAMSVRGDSLAGAGRWCEAAKAHEQAYQAMATRAVPLLAWAETSWRCEPDRKADRGELLTALEKGSESKRFGPVEQISIAYMRWWLTRDRSDAQRVLVRYTELALGKVGLVEGVGSDLEREICRDSDGPDCSLRILRGLKQAGDEERLRAALGLLL